MDNLIEIKVLKNPKLAKCNCCDKVKDICYKAILYDVDDSDLMFGDLDLCRACGNNLNKIIGNKNNPDEKVIQEFDFTQEGGF